MTHAYQLVLQDKGFAPRNKEFQIFLVIYVSVLQRIASNRPSDN